MNVGSIFVGLELFHFQKYVFKYPLNTFKSTLFCNPKFETPQQILPYCRLKKWENYSCGSRLDTDQTNGTVCSQHRLRTRNTFCFFNHIPNDLANWADWPKKL